MTETLTIAVNYNHINKHINCGEKSRAREVRGVPKLILISYGNQKAFITEAVVGGVARPDLGRSSARPKIFTFRMDGIFSGKIPAPGRRHSQSMGV
jgi:hypothetical protein